MRNTLLKTGSIVVAEKEGQDDTEWKVMERGAERGKVVVSLKKLKGNQPYGRPVYAIVRGNMDEIDGIEQMVEWVDGKKLGAELAYVK